jgi:hypothetical protein
MVTALQVLTVYKRHGHRQQRGPGRRTASTPVRLGTSIEAKWDTAVKWLRHVEAADSRAAARTRSAVNAHWAVAAHFRDAWQHMTHLQAPSRGPYWTMVYCTSGLIHWSNVSSVPGDPSDSTNIAVGRVRQHQPVPSNVLNRNIMPGKRRRRQYSL